MSSSLTEDPCPELSVSSKSFRLDVPAVMRLSGYPASMPADGGSVHVLLGRPASGKTAIALHLAMSAAATGRYVLYAEWDWARSFLSSRSSEWIGIKELRRLSKFHFSDAMTLPELDGILPKLPTQSLIVLDYLQAVPVPSVPEGYARNSIEGRCSYVADWIQARARRDGHIFLVLSSQNREGMKKDGPDPLNSGQGSSKIEYAADSLYLVQGHREDHDYTLKALKERWSATDRAASYTYRLSSFSAASGNGSAASGSGTVTAVQSVLLMPEPEAAPYRREGGPL